MTDENKKYCWGFWTWLIFCFFTIGAAVVGIWLFAKIKDWKIIFFFGAQILIVIGLAIFIRIMRPVAPQISSHTSISKDPKKTIKTHVIVGILFVASMAAGIYLNRDDITPFIYADRDIGPTKEIYIKNGFFKSRFYVKNGKGIREFANSNLNARLVGAKISLSPDEKRVAVLYQYKDDPKIYIIDIVDSNPKRVFSVKERIKPPLRFFDRNYGCKSINWEDNDTIRFGQIRSWGKWEPNKKGHKMITRYYLLDISSDNSEYNLRVGDEKVEYVKFPRGIF